MKPFAALLVSLALVVCCHLVTVTWEQVAYIESAGRVRAVQVECEARSASIREQLQLQIGAILQAAPEGESEAGTYVFPMPMIPGQSAE